MVLNAAVVGVGNMGKNHARVYSDLKETKLVAVCDKNKNAKKIAAQYKAEYFLDFEKMIQNENIDLVSVAVPTFKHKDVVLPFLKQKIPVLLEKPLALNLKEAKTIISKAKKYKTKLMIGHIERFNPAIIELKKQLQKKVLDDVYAIDINRRSPFPKTITDVGVTIDLAVHDLDIILQLTNSKVKKIKAETHTWFHSTDEDIMRALIKFKNGMIASLNIDWVTPTKMREINVTGHKGMLKADYITQELTFYKNNYPVIDKTYSEMIKGVIAGPVKKINVKKQEPLRNEILAMADFVKKGKNPVTATDSLKALELAFDILKTAKK